MLRLNSTKGTQGSLPQSIAQPRGAPCTARPCPKTLFRPSIFQPEAAIKLGNLQRKDIVSEISHQTWNILNEFVPGDTDLCLAFTKYGIVSNLVTKMRLL